MTSSLVGSEMCIRDRWERLRSVRYGGYHVGVPLLGAHCGWRSASIRFVCLLYTSDAADDM
eukprot:7745861-Prorocentrum_lima.AAC.1